jgi:hypothetical protein
MRSVWGSGRVVSFTVLVLGTSSCGPDAHPPATVAPPVVDAGPPVATASLPDIPLPVLRTGDMPPTVGASITLVPRGRAVSGGSQITAYKLPARKDSDYQLTTVRIEGPGSAFVHISNVATAGSEATLWVSRPAAVASTPLRGHLYLPFLGYVGTPGVDQPFTADAQAKTEGPVDKDLVASWLEAASTEVHYGRSDRFFGNDASYRIDRLRAKEHPPKASPGTKAKTRGKTAKQQAEELRYRTEQDRSRAQSALDERLGVLSGGTGVAAAVALGRNNGAAGGLTAADKKRIPFEQVKALALPPTAWNQLTAVPPPPPEPLATVVPAEFYYVRATDVPALQAVLATVEKWGNAADRVLDGSVADDRIVTRYETALGVQRGVLVRLLGTTAVGQVALTGSDLYLAEGSDLSVILEVRSQPLVDAALGGALAARAKDHGEVKETTREHGGVTVREARTVDGAVRRQRADVGGRTILSTSPVAMDRILDTIAGQHPRLSDEQDFQHLLGRDSLAQVSAITFAGDRFFAEVTGLRQRILESRRRIARDELVALGESALLYGWLFGQEPKTTAEILHAGLLVPAETRHSSGEAITFVPGSAPHSTWGSPSELQPLLEMPTPTTVSGAESDAYQRFASSYRNLWNEHLDPLMVRFTVHGDETTVDLRQMPVPWTREYRDFSTVAGDVHLDVPPIGNGIRFTAAIGKDSELRHLANEMAGNLNDKLKNALDWIGDSASIGVLDDHYLAASSRLAYDEWNVLEPPAPRSATDDDSHKQREDEDTFIYNLPAYATIDVGNPITAGLLVATLRKEVEGELKDDIVWREIGKEGDATIFGVEMKSDRGWFSHAHLVYSFASGALVLAFREDVLRTILRERASGKKALATPGRGGAQHVLELAHEKTGGLASILVWMSEMGALAGDRDDARGLADYIYRGAPSVDADPAAFERLASAYFGGVPRPADGGAFTFGADGTRDPWRGTFSHPVWPALPIPDSEVSRAVTDLARLRAELSFDPEGKTPIPSRPAPGGNDAAVIAPRSLHARLTFTQFSR